MLRVLIIEDLPLNRMLTIAVIERAGHTALAAETAEDGIAMAREQRPDVILMDIQLPQMDGLAATRLIKGDLQLHDIPVIALTALAMKGDERLIRDAGCDSYITKPIHYATFVSEIERVAAGRPLDTVGHLPQRTAARTD